MAKYWFEIAYDNQQIFDDEGFRGTYIWVYDSKEKLDVGSDFITSGTALCHPNDHFKRTTGRKVALTKAIASLDRDTRTVIWTDFWGYVKQKD